MKLFNSMSRKKEEFVPITPGESTWATPAP